ncbi:MAG: hypothetical protein V2I27_08615 [Erythrobacter sp.]|jgi:hypothetical protein|nr:hypothetical protein [Erythrobacter sp.]
MSTFPLPEWASDPGPAAFTDPALIEARATRFARTIRRRNIVEYAAGGLVLVVFTIAAFFAASVGEWLIGAACSLVALGDGVMMWQLHARASLAPPSPEQSCRDHLRAQYMRQYEALRTVPVWYLAPLVPGGVAFYVAVTARVADVIGWRAALEDVWPIALASFGLLAAIALANWLAARALRKQIERLDELA